MEKMTIAKMYEGIIAKVEGVLSQAEIDFLNERKEMHLKKNASRKPTKAQEENENIKASILDFMKDGKLYTITEIQKGVGLESNQKTSALVRQLKDKGLVIRSENKGKAYFGLA
jgi:predicted transcriptional regulator